MTSDWIPLWPEHTSTDRRSAVVVFPPAGAGCHQFRPWGKLLPAGVDVLGVQLPGREERWLHPMPGTVAEAVDDIAAALSAVVDPHTPMVLFGHSFGALLAYEASRRLTESGMSVAHLAVSAARSPSHWVGPGRGISTDDDELDHLLDVASLPDLLRTPEIRDLMIEMLRKDAALSGTYAPAPGRAPLDVPMDVWHANADVTVTSEEIKGWAQATTAPVVWHELQGGHHAILRRPTRLLQRLAHLTTRLDIQAVAS